MNKWLNTIIVIISLVTVVMGLSQMVAPTLIMENIDADITATSALFFRLLGLFIFLFGGLMLHTVYSSEAGKPAVLWAAWQKFGASVGIGGGIVAGIFSWQALGVALFDLLSGVLFLYYYSRLR